MNYRFWKYGLVTQVRKYKRLITILTWIVVLLLIGQTIWRGWKELNRYSLHFRIGPLILSVFFLMAALLSGSMGWHLVLRAIGIRSSIAENMMNWIVAQMSKYLPGGTIWYLGGRFLQNKQIGLENSAISLALTLEFILYVVEAFVYSGLALTTWSRLTWRWLVISISVAVNILWWLSIPSFLSFAHKQLSFNQKWANDIKRVLENISGKRLRWLPFFYLFTWILTGQAVGCLFESIYPITWIERVAIGGAFSFSSLVGYLVFLIPGGWGVRESVLALIINEINPYPLGSSFSILARLWYVGVEVLCALTSWVMSSALERRCTPIHPKGVLK